MVALTGPPMGAPQCAREPARTRPAVIWLADSAWVRRLQTSTREALHDLPKQWIVKLAWLPQ